MGDYKKPDGLPKDMYLKTGDLTSSLEKSTIPLFQSFRKFLRNTNVSCSLDDFDGTDDWSPTSSVPSHVIMSNSSKDNHMVSIGETNDIRRGRWQFLSYHPTAYQVNSDNQQDLKSNAASNLMMKDDDLPNLKLDKKESHRRDINVIAPTIY